MKKKNLKLNKKDMINKYENYEKIAWEPNVAQGSNA